jgi:hypothetical protein
MTLDLDEMKMLQALDLGHFCVGLSMTHGEGIK